MQVHVKLYSRFQAYLSPEAQGEAILELPVGATVGDLLARLGIDEHVNLLSVDGRRETDWARVLHDGAMVRIFPIVVGG
jgi:molybdopterin converting factor small subunit